MGGGVILHIDERFVFNAFFYILALVCAPFFSWNFYSKSGSIFKICVILIFMSTMIAIHFIPGIYSTNYRRGASALGVFAVLFFCELLSKVIFDKKRLNNCEHTHTISDIFKYVSYASMAVYMFHRLFFWVGELIWSPSNTMVKWLYMGGLVFPVIVVISYYIQFSYDKLVNIVVIKRS